MDKRNGRRASRLCVAGIVNHAVIANLSALLFVPFMRLYGFTYIQFGILTAAGFGAQMTADIVLVFFIDRLPARALVGAASALGFAGLVFYGVSPWLFTGGALFCGIAVATVVFAFAGGTLEVVLSGIADSLPEGRGGIVLLHTVYAWALCALALFLPVFMACFGMENWNIAVLLLAAVPAWTGFSLIGVQFPASSAPRADERMPEPAAEQEGQAPCKRRGGQEQAARGRAEKRRASSFLSPFYLFAAAAVFFGCGAEAVMNQWVATYAAELLGSEWGSALGAALFALCLGGGGVLYVLRLRRKGVSFFLLVSSAAAAFVLYLLAALLPWRIPALVCAAACGFFAGILSPGAMSAAAAGLPTAGGRMIAALSVSQDVGAALLPSAGSAIAEKFSVRSCFLVLSAAPLLAAAALALMARAGRKAENFQRDRRNFSIRMRKR